MALSTARRRAAGQEWGGRGRSGRCADAGPDGGGPASAGPALSLTCRAPGCVLVGAFGVCEGLVKKGLTVGGGVPYKPPPATERPLERTDRKAGLLIDIVGKRRDARAAA